MPHRRLTACCVVLLTAAAAGSSARAAAPRCVAERGLARPSEPLCPPATGSRTSALHTASDLGTAGSAIGLGVGAPPVGGAGGALGAGVSGIASSATTGLALSMIGNWVSGSATFVLHETADVLNRTTEPSLDSAWFSSAYWRVGGIAAVLTLPFLFAASVQALLRSDLALLIRAVGGYLPLAMLAVAIAAPVTMLLLSASDQLAAAVSSAAGNQGTSFLNGAIGPLAAVTAISASPFLAFLIALFTVAGALILWIELLMREAAVYVIVLMLPLAFAALVWPARRIWAIRSVELLVALVLSKFAIVAVLSLGGAALGHIDGSVAGMLAGVVLLMLGAFAPWALLRLLPLAEIASGTAGALRGHSGGAVRALQSADGWATEAQRWANRTSQMRRAAEDVRQPVAPADARRVAPAAPGEASTSPGETSSTSPGETSVVTEHEQYLEPAETVTESVTPASAARPPSEMADPPPAAWITKDELPLDLEALGPPRKGPNGTGEQS